MPFFSLRPFAILLGHFLKVRPRATLVTPTQLQVVLASAMEGYAAMSLCRYLLALMLVLAAHNSSRTLAGEQSASDDASSSTQAEIPNAITEMGPDNPTVSLEAIEELKQQATEVEQLSTEAKAEIIELCDKATAKLVEADAFVATTAKLQQELEDSASTLDSLQSKTDESEPAALPTATFSSDEMRSQLSSADQQVSAAREKMKKFDAEIERRAERRKALPELLANCRNQLASALEPLNQPDVEERPMLASARKLYLFARREFHEKELLSLEQENRTYEATSRLWLARRDSAEKNLQTAIERHKTILTLAADAQRLEAERQALKARRSAINVHPTINAAAARNAELAERNQKLVRRTQEVQQCLAEARELGQNMQKRLADVTKRAETAKYSPAIGIMLRSQRDQLPALGPYRYRMDNRPAEISQLGLDIYEWDAQRREVLHVDKAVEFARQEIEAAGAGAIHEEVAAELRRVLEARADILADLYNNADDCLSRLVELDAAELSVITTTEELRSFIAEHVLWVRSAPSLSLSEIKLAINSWQGWEGSIEQAQVLRETLLADVRRNPLWWSFAGLMPVIVVIGRNRVRNELRSCGEAAVKPTAILFRPTVDASLATILMAAPVPVLVGFVGWRLCQSNLAFPHATGWAMVLFATVYAMLNLVRHTSRCGGLGTNHFGWDQKGLAAIRRATRSLQLLALPLLALAGGIEVAHGESMLNTIGRLSLIAALLGIGVVCCRLFRATGPLANSLAARAKGWGSTRTMQVLIPFSILAVIGLIAASAAGYHYTAMQLTRRVFVSCVFVFACLALRSLLMRWLLVAYRRVAMQHSREKRRALLEAQEDNSAESPIIEMQPQMNLSNINQQARKLVGVGAALAFVASMWFIWGDVMPALGIFSRVELWASGLVSDNPAGETTFVTFADLIFAVGMFAFTWFAGSNLPGLLEIAVLQKLPLDAGARYAASSVTRYVIVVVGTALCMRQLGVGWQSVQWLVAAMTVGLGFGSARNLRQFCLGDHPTLRTSGTCW